LKKLLAILFILFSLNVFASESNLADGVFTIRDIFSIFNIFAGMFWEFLKAIFWFLFLMPSYIIVSSLIDTSFGSFLEFPEYGYTIAPYLSLGYWIGGFILLIKIDVAYPNRNIGLPFLVYSYGLFVLGIIGFINGWWLNQELTLEFFRVEEFLNCLNGDFPFCLALF